MSIQEILDSGKVPQPGELWQELIDEMKNRPLRTFEFDITIGEASAPVVISELRGKEWADLAGELPRPGRYDDFMMGGFVSKYPGYPGAFGRNSDAFLRDYPPHRISIAGEHPTAEQWHEIVDLLDAPSREDFIIALQWLHWGATAQEEREIRAESEGPHE